MASATTIRFEMARPGLARLEVFDVAGRCVRTLLHKHRAAGMHELSWTGEDESGRSLAPGIYLMRLVAHGHHDEHRVVKIR
jgi:flagellar hook assembly protein FlgD